MSTTDRRDEPNPSVSAFVAEAYWPGVTAEKLRRLARRVRQIASDMSRRGTPVTFLGSILMPRDEIAFCLFRAVSSASVEELNVRAGRPFARISEAVQTVVPAAVETGG